MLICIQLCKSLRTSCLGNSIHRGVILTWNIYWRRWCLKVSLRGLLRRLLLLHIGYRLIVFHETTLILLFLSLLCYDFCCMSVILIGFFILLGYFLTNLFRPREYNMTIGCNCRTFDLSFKLVDHLIISWEHVFLFCCHTLTAFTILLAHYCSLLGSSQRIFW